MSRDRLENSFGYFKFSLFGNIIMTIFFRFLLLFVNRPYFTLRLRISFIFVKLGRGLKNVLIKKNDYFICLFEKCLAH